MEDGAEEVTHNTYKRVNKSLHKKIKRLIEKNSSLIELNQSRQQTLNALHKALSNAKATNETIKTIQEAIEPQTTSARNLSSITEKILNSMTNMNEKVAEFLNNVQEDDDTLEGNELKINSSEGTLVSPEQLNDSQSTSKMPTMSEASTSTCKSCGQYLSKDQISSYEQLIKDLKAQLASYEKHEAKSSGEMVMVTNEIATMEQNFEQTSSETSLQILSEMPLEDLEGTTSQTDPSQD